MGEWDCWALSTSQESLQSKLPVSQHSKTLGSPRSDLILSDLILSDLTAALSDLMAVPMSDFSATPSDQIAILSDLPAALSDLPATFQQKVHTG